jgi:hypothetical protein
METKFDLHYLGINGVELHKEIQSNLDKILALPALDKRAGFRIITVMAEPDGIASSKEEYIVSYVVSFFKQDPSKVLDYVGIENPQELMKDNHLTGERFTHEELNKYPFASYALAFRKPKHKE